MPLVRPPSQQKEETDALVSVVKSFGALVVVTGDLNMTPFSTRYGTLLQKNSA